MSKKSMQSLPTGRRYASALKMIMGQSSWRLANKQVEVYLTRSGGNMGPVNFFHRKDTFSPLAVAPWHNEKAIVGAPPIQHVQRGDFFCLPFGANIAPYRGEKHPPHGETANGIWTLQEATDNRLVAKLDCTIRPAQVRKEIAIQDGQHVVYIRHLIQGMSGSMCFGHHAMLHWDGAEAGLISTSPFVFGQVFPDVFENPAEGGYSCLSPGAYFDNLAKVPKQDGSFADLTVYPARRGFEDLVMVCCEKNLPFAWSAAVYPKSRKVWFSLKDPAKLSSTVLWHSNDGRHYPPWNGRHLGVLGIEEVTANFAYGLAQSVSDNPIKKRGIETCRKFTASQPYSVPYIMASAVVPANFDHVAIIEPVAKSKVRLVSKSGKIVYSSVNWEFLAVEP